SPCCPAVESPCASPWTEWPYRCPNRPSCACCPLPERCCWYGPTRPRSPNPPSPPPIPGDLPSRSSAWPDPVDRLAPIPTDIPGTRWDFGSVVPPPPGPGPPRRPAEETRETGSIHDMPTVPRSGHSRVDGTRVPKETPTKFCGKIATRLPASIRADTVKSPHSQQTDTGVLSEDKSDDSYARIGVSVAG